jgi:hypothetical protein
MIRPYRSLASLLFAALSLGAFAQPATTDPLCDLEMAGVNLESTVADMNKAWSALGLAHVAVTTEAVRGRPANTTYFYAKNPASPDRAEWGPLQLSRSVATNGDATLKQARESTVRVVRKVGQSALEEWRGFDFADLVMLRVARFCNGVEPRASCRFEGSMPRSIEVRPPRDHRLPYCTYALSIDTRQGRLRRSTVGEREFELGGLFGERLSRHTATAYDSMPEGR